MEIDSGGQTGSIRDMGQKYYNEELSCRKWLVLVGAFFNHVVVFGASMGAGVFQVRLLEPHVQADQADPSMTVG